ncbi:hypothetical protein BDV95DRAFT_482031 [Massariosphaeria phaeospora]|uniref:Uncharacterized protein n=1 Tax=Massariosphaeria phaeospora TaxID=100035 RepID=A0A7C8MIU2_9PLEO|nr:hypothetical protein BDV95DRAFT_482031 [Massariosphaeria phaeospora]
MPGLFTPPPAGASSRSSAGFFASAPFSETTGHQVDDPGDYGTRKRSRQSGDLEPSHPAHAETTHAWPGSSLQYSQSFNVMSPPPLANDRYELAGGMEGSDRFGRHNGDYDDYFQLEKQRGMWTPMGAPNQPPSYLAVQETPDGNKPWLFNQILSKMGGVAGKLFQFCTVPFRGFQGGGGQAYTADGHAVVAAKLGLQDDPFNTQGGPIQQSQLRSNYLEDNYGVLSVDSVESGRPRMSKRLKTGESWVVVDRDGEVDSRPSTPRLSERRIPNCAESPSHIPRPVSRAGATTPVLKRPSLIPVSRRSTLDIRSFHGATQEAAQSYNTPRSYSRQSYGSPAMFEDKTKKSPLPVESQRLINKMRREEMEDDARLRRMSAQMSSMLREAQEALGTKAPVEYEDD